MSVFITWAACCCFRTENFECLEDLVRVVVREFPLVSANVGKQRVATVCHASC